MDIFKCKGDSLSTLCWKIHGMYLIPSTSFSNERRHRPTQHNVFKSIFKTIFKERYPSFGDRIEVDLKFMSRCERAILYSPVEWSQGPYVFFNSTFILRALT